MVQTGSDNHNAREYTLKIPNWIRGNPTFQGLRQILNEPVDRVHRGDSPPILKRVAENKTKYVNGVTAKKVPNSTLPEIWFDCGVPLNPGLVAVIGNKGSGKSALSDIIGLVGETRHGGSFSFLNADKFRQPKNNKARHFEASLSWENGSVVTKPLDEDTDPTAVEAVKYIPQNYLETVCNELRGGGESRFDSELKSVIFSHVPEASRIDAESLDELIEYRTKETYSSITLLRSELHKVNEEIVAFEQMLAPAFKRSLQAQLAEKQREIEAHDAIRPAPVSKPELDPAKQAEMSALTLQIEEAQAALADLEAKRKTFADQQKALTRRVAVATKFGSKIENSRKQHQLFVKDASLECAELGLAVDDLVRLIIDTAPIVAIHQSTAER